MEKNSQPRDFSLQQAIELAQTTAGQQLIAHLQNIGGQEFQNALSKAASGDYEQAKSMISAMLTNPEAQELLRKLGG